jgi:hypothetical protein
LTYQAAERRAAVSVPVFLDEVNPNSSALLGGIFLTFCLALLAQDAVKTASIELVVKDPGGAVTPERIYPNFRPI